MDPSPNPLPTPLAEFHRAHGAQVGSWFDCALPDNFGDWQAEYAFARENVALIDKNFRAYLNFTGPDRVRFLNAILTNNIKGLADHRGNASLFLNPQGHIQAEIECYAWPEKILGVSFAMIRPRLLEDLDKYIIMDDVILTDVSEQFGTLALEGPKAAECVSKLTGANIGEMAELQFLEGAAGSIPCTITRRTLAGLASAEFLVEHAHLEPLWNLLLACATENGGGAMGFTALNALRLEQAIPWFGYDFGEKQIPHEAGLQDSHISYTKGCYTGQEIVERVRSRGQVNRKRVSLKFDTKHQPAPDTPLFDEGKEIGYVTRSAFSLAANAFIGMGYIRREKAIPGSILKLLEGTATVYAGPLTSIAKA